MGVLTAGVSTLPEAIQRLLEVQHNVVLASQLADAALPRARLRWLVDSGEWRRTDRGLYFAGRGLQPWLSRLSGVSLLSGPDGVIGGTAAARLHGLVTEDPGGVTVFVPIDRKRQEPTGAQLTRTRIPRRTQTVQGLLCTTAAETILDCAEVMSGNELEALVGRAFQRRRCSRSALRKALVGRRTVAQRNLLIAAAHDAEEGAHSLFETQYLRAVERPHGLPTAARQIRVGEAHEWVDVCYTAFGLVVELDGKAFHERSAFRDRRRDNRNARAGLRTLRYGWSDVTTDPCSVAAEVACCLIDRGWDGRRLVSCGGLCPI